MAFGRKTTQDVTPADASAEFGLGVEGGYGHPGLTELIEAKAAEAETTAQAAAPSQAEIDAETVETMESLRHLM